MAKRGNKGIFVAAFNKGGQEEHPRNNNMSAETNTLQIFRQSFTYLAQQSEGRVTMKLPRNSEAPEIGNWVHHQF